MYCDGVNLSWRDIFQELISGEAAHAERQHIPGDLLFSLPPQSQENTHLFHEMYAGWVFLREFLRQLYETVANLVGGVGVSCDSYVVHALVSLLRSSKRSHFQDPHLDARLEASHPKQHGYTVLGNLSSENGTIGLFRHSAPMFSWMIEFADKYFHGFSDEYVESESEFNAWLHDVPDQHRKAHVWDLVVGEALEKEPGTCNMTPNIFELAPFEKLSFFA